MPATATAFALWLRLHSKNARAERRYAERSSWRSRTLGEKLNTQEVRHNWSHSH